MERRRKWAQKFQTPLRPFNAQATGIRDVRWKKEDGRSIIYNLQGQRLSTLQKGLNIVNGQKVFVK